MAKNISTIESDKQKKMDDVVLEIQKELKEDLATYEAEEE